MADSGKDILLSVRDLRVEIPLKEGGVVRAVDGVDFDIFRGEILGLVGESGSGKSMTLMSILQLLPKPAEIIDGSITFEGRDLRTATSQAVRDIRGNTIAMIPADALAALNPVARVGAQTAQVIEDHAPRTTAKDRAVRVVQSLKRVHLPDPELRVNTFPHQLSGGMQQRVVIATGLLLSPTLLLADEPTTALDATVQAQILRLLRDIRDKDGVTILFVSHDLATVAEICDRILVMYAARLVETGPIDEVFSEPLHPYTTALLASSPSMTADDLRELPTIPGAPPSLTKRANGCSFAPRCWLRDRLGRPDRCDVEEPALRVVSDTRSVACHFADQGLVALTDASGSRVSLYPKAQPHDESMETS